MEDDSNEIPTGKKGRNRILDENMQSHVKLKLISNAKNINLDEIIYLERYKHIGFSTYIKVKHNLRIKRSNISEISDLDGNILWKK